MEGPSGLHWLRTGHAGQAWLDSLPELIEECSESWTLRIGEAFPYAFASIALAAERNDGSQVVLKIQYPHGESEFEAAALTAELGLDRDRARGWAFSQTLAWSHEDSLFDVDAVEVARWIFDR